MASANAMPDEIESLLARIRHTEDCIVRPPTGELPIVGDAHQIPDDLRRFYARCGGCTLYTRGVVTCDIVAPRDMVAANPRIVGSGFDFADDRSNAWFIVASRGVSEHITIDLSSERLGRCYESFWDTHAVAGSCAIVATSFSELLRGLYEARGESWFWMRPEFERIGDAYD